ncbi:MAG TPA: hypothetical protein VEH58_07465 [Dehalococcoidales bacterium]|nr:hypothetical protein [Dehalococcoidales bacterium]
MRMYDRYLLTLAIVLSIINIVLAVFNVSNFAGYYIGNVIAFMVITLLFVHFNQQARRALTVVSSILFAGFLVIAIFKVVDILAIN